MLWWSGMLMKIASFQTYSLRNLIQNLPSPSSKCFLLYWGSLRFQKIMTLHFRWWALIIKKGKKHRSSSNLEFALLLSSSVSVWPSLLSLWDYQRWESLAFSGLRNKSYSSQAMPFPSLRPNGWNCRQVH